MVFLPCPAASPARGGGPFSGRDTFITLRGEKSNPIKSTNFPGKISSDSTKRARREIPSARNKEALFSEARRGRKLSHFAWVKSLSGTVSRFASQKSQWHSLLLRFALEKSQRHSLLLRFALEKSQRHSLLLHFALEKSQRHSLLLHFALEKSEQHSPLSHFASAKCAPRGDQISGIRWLETAAHSRVKFREIRGPGYLPQKWIKRRDWR